MKNEVRFFYMRDPENPDRLVTTARRWANEERTVIEVAFAVNNPTSGWRREYYHDPVWIEGDKPSKPRGRQIATGRLMKHPFVVELGGRRQLTAICEMLQSRPEPILTESGEQERDGHGKLLFRPSEAWWAAYNGLKDLDLTAEELQKKLPEDGCPVPQCVRRIAGHYFEQFLAKEVTQDED